MLSLSRRKDDPPPTGFDEEGRDRRLDAARRAMAILCSVLLLLGAVSVVSFIVEDIGDLTDEQAAATTTLVDLGPEPVQEPDPSRAPVPTEWDAARSAIATAEQNVHRGWGRLGAMGLALAVIAFFLVYQRPRVRSVTEITHACTLMILITGAILLASRLFVARAIDDYPILGLIDLVVMHLAVCLIMPWNAREATMPFGALMVVWAATFLVPHATEFQMLDRVVAVIVSPVVLVPGALLAKWRAQRRAEDEQRIELAGRVEHFGGELSRARIVHDAMFPRPFTGHVAFEYEYQPIHEIGGDYVHTNVCPDTGRVMLTLLDVAGHGLAAALTVNRLFGELERILAEHRDAEPAQITSLLNRYIFLTMSRHSLFATGTCMLLDPASGVLKWVSAGHPPSLVRHADGRVAELETTAALMGAIEPESFDPDQAEMKLSPGEVVIAYTDGAFEARNAEGMRFGMDRVRETACFDPPPRSWPKFIAGAVAQHHQGYADDDVLIAALTLRSLRVPDLHEMELRKMAEAKT
ncbi:MAG: serine/threonine-protein phosphatase [Planctomycetes bacterium]|nr:serine/threonine-protein phosphatase [Planctomycetota bacterium]